MKKVLIKDLFNIRKGRKETETDSAGIRYIQIEDLRNDDNLKFCEENDKNILINENDIIIAWDGANAGIVDFGLEGALGSTLGRLRLKEEIDSDLVNTHYVGFFLKSKENYIKDNTTGATIPHVSRTVLQNIEIDLPSVSRQNKIVEMLNKIVKTMSLRQQQIEALSELKQSVFLDMFGDPVSNEKDWKTKSLKELGLLARGKSTHRPRNASELLNGPYPLIQTGDIPKGTLYIENYKQTYSELGLKQSKLWPKGTLCITIAANIAHTGILTFDACFPDSVVGFTPNEGISNVFISLWFSFLQENIERNAPMSAQKNINLRILNGLEVIVPPEELQEVFEVKINKIENQIKLLEESKLKLKDLYNSILQKAFNGELFKEKTNV